MDLDPDAIAVSIGSPAALHGNNQVVESILTDQGQLLSSQVIKWIPETPMTGLTPAATSI